jgi:inorganic phosphate transporter, PiT family
MLTLDMLWLGLAILGTLGFTFSNGFHDAAPSLSTVVGTSVLNPRQALVLMTVTNVLGSVCGLAVARTLATGLVDHSFLPPGSTPLILACAVIAALGWNALSWWYGMPSSSSHALIGSLVGASLGAAVAVAAVHPLCSEAGVPLTPWSATVRWEVPVVGLPQGEVTGLLPKVLKPMVLSPLIGFGGGFGVMALLYGIARAWRPVTVDRCFSKAQLASAACVGFTHGMNDAAKGMGLILLALMGATRSGLLQDVPSWLEWLRLSSGVAASGLWVPGWVILSCALAMGMGTALGGWRSVKSMGHRMVKLQPIHGFAAETTAAVVSGVTAVLGMPVSTTHVITTSTMGVGCAKRFSALKLKVVERILWAWILTLPATGGLAFGLVWLAAKTGLLQME